MVWNLFIGFTRCEEVNKVACCVKGEDVLRSLTKCVAFEI